MPLEMIEVTDRIGEMVTFRTSPVYEMIISLRTLLQTARHPQWVADMRQRLPNDFWDELRALYEPYHNGSVFFELGIDYPDQDNVPGFIEYVRTMDPVSFMFYIVGRVLSKEEIASTDLDPDALTEMLVHSPAYAHCLCVAAPVDQILVDVPAFQQRLARLWEWYWCDFFQDQIAAFRPHWQHSLNDKMRFLNRNGGQALYEHISNRKNLPPPLPAEMPITEITFIPLYLIPTSVYQFYGYGNVTIMFDSERTEARMAEIERNKQRAMEAFKALGDDTRLAILRLIANAEHKMHGKKLAAHLDLSPSAVSRHLAQLRDAGLITEEIHSDRTITYQLQTERVQALPNELLDYLYH